MDIWALMEYQNAFLAAAFGVHLIVGSVRFSIFFSFSLLRPLSISPDSLPPPLALVAALSSPFPFFIARRVEGGFPQQEPYAAAPGSHVPEFASLSHFLPLHLPFASSPGIYPLAVNEVPGFI